MKSFIDPSTLTKEEQIKYKQELQALKKQLFSDIDKSIIKAREELISSSEIVDLTLEKINENIGLLREKLRQKALEKIAQIIRSKFEEESKEQATNNKTGMNFNNNF